MKFDHIGILVKDAESMIDRLKLIQDKSMNVKVSDQTDFYSYFITFGGSKLELIEPCSPDHSLKHRVDKNGNGLHHLSYEVPNVRAFWKQCNKKFGSGVGEISTVHVCKDRFEYFFIHPKCTDGILIEVHQKLGE